MGPVEQQASGTTQKATVSFKAIEEGVRFILNQPLILATMILDFFATFFASANTLMPIVAVDVLHVGPVEYGWLSSAQAIGAMAAALVISQMRAIRRQGVTFLLAVVAFQPWPSVWREPSFTPCWLSSSLGLPIRSAPSSATPSASFPPQITCAGG
jgi:hypothetical protein